MERRADSAMTTAKTTRPGQRRQKRPNQGAAPSTGRRTDSGIGDTGKMPAFVEKSVHEMHPLRLESHLLYHQSPLYMVYAKSSGVYTLLHILYRGRLLRPVPPTQWPHIGRSQRTTARRPTHVLTLADSKRLHYAVAPSEPRTAASAAGRRRGLDHSCHPKDVMRLDGLRARQTTVKRPPRKT